MIPFFSPPVSRLLEKKRDRNLSLSLSPSLEQRVKRDLTLSSELNDIANTFRGEQMSVSFLIKILSLHGRNERSERGMERKKETRREGG